MPERSYYEIRFPRVEGYSQAVRNRVTVDWDAIATLRLDPMIHPPEVEMKVSLPAIAPRPSLVGPGRLESVSLNPFRSGQRFQSLVFDLARDLTRTYVNQSTCEVPPHALFPQLVKIVERYLREKVEPLPPAEIVDAFLSPYYGMMIEQLVQAIQPDTSAGEAPEVPRYEANRGPGSTAEVDFWTSRDLREVLHSHLNFAVADTARWEQSAVYVIDRHPKVDAFVKNSGLGFAIPYLHNGQAHEYLPDFVIRLKDDSPRYLILEVKGFDEREQVKVQAAARWVAAVNADGTYGHWAYAIVKRVSDIGHLLDEAAAAAGAQRVVLG